MRTPSGDAIYYVIERGTHEELMAADGLYANLCRVQSTAVTIEERLDELEERLNAQRPTFNAQRVTSQGREDERPAVSARGYRRKEGEWGSGKLRREQPEDGTRGDRVESGGMQNLRLPQTTAGLLREYDVQRLALLGSVGLGSQKRRYNGSARRCPYIVKG